MSFMRNNKVVKTVRRKNQKKGPKRANRGKRKILPKANNQVERPETCVTTASVATITEPKYLGPCEPGSSATLSGFVCCETEEVLVVNVAWKGKTYIGSLLETAGSDWAPAPPLNRIPYTPRTLADTSRLISGEVEHTAVELNCLRTRSSKKYSKGPPPKPTEKKEGKEE